MLPQDGLIAFGITLIGLGAYSWAKTKFVRQSADDSTNNWAKAYDETAKAHQAKAKARGYTPAIDLGGNWGNSQSENYWPRLDNPYLGKHDAAIAAIIAEEDAKIFGRGKDPSPAQKAAWAKIDASLNTGIVEMVCDEMFPAANKVANRQNEPDIVKLSENGKENLTVVTQELREANIRSESQLRFWIRDKMPIIMEQNRRRGQQCGDAGFTHAGLLRCGLHPE